MLELLGARDVMYLSRIVLEHRASIPYYILARGEVNERQVYFPNWYSTWIGDQAWRLIYDSEHSSSFQPYGHQPYGQDVSEYL